MLPTLISTDSAAAGDNQILLFFFFFFGERTVSRDAGIKWGDDEVNGLRL